MKAHSFVNDIPEYRLLEPEQAATQITNIYGYVCN